MNVPTSRKYWLGHSGWLTVWFIVVLVIACRGPLTASGRAAERDRPVRIGALTDSWGPTPATIGLRDGLLALGYVENKDFVIGVRFTQGNLAILPTAARELIDHGVDIIFPSDEGSVKAAQAATDQIPIVFAGISDPLGSGLVTSFARPSGNITGITDLSLEMGPKRLEMFRKLVVGLKRVLFPYDANDAFSVAEAKMYGMAAERLGVVVIEKPLHTEEEAQITLSRVRNDRVDGILKPRFHSLNIPGFILETTLRQAMPTMFNGPFWVERGGFASYGPDLYASGRQAARLVDKILKGAKPATLPVEVNTKIELAINLKVAKALGLSIASEVLFQANRVIR